MKKNKLNALAMMAEGTEKLNEGMKALIEAEGAEVESDAKEAVAKASKVVSKSSKKEEKVVDLATKKKAKVEKATKAEEAKDDEFHNVPEPSEDVTSDDVDGMGYNTMKKLAAKLNVSAKGTKAQLVSRLKEALDNGGSVDEDEEEEEAPKKSAKKSKAKPARSSKKSEPEPEEDDEEDEESEDEEDDSDSEDMTMEQLKEELDEYSDEDLKGMLKEIGKSTKGKRTALISKIYDAIKAGEISLSDDEDEEEDDDVDEGEVESEDDEDNEVPDGTEDDDEDEESDESDEEEEESDDEEDEDEDTEARIKAMTALEKKIRKDFKKGNVTVSDMKEFLSSYDDVKVGKKTSDEKVLELYIENAKMLVDDNGDTIEEGAYEIKGVLFCCGRALDIDEDGNCKCPICGSEYELGEGE